VEYLQFVRVGWSSCWLVRWLCSWPGCFFLGFFFVEVWCGCWYGCAHYLVVCCYILYVHCPCAVYIIVQTHLCIANTLRHTTFGRTLEEWSVHRRDLYLTTHNTHKKQKSMTQRDSIPQSQEASGCGPKPKTARPLGSAYICINICS